MEQTSQMSNENASPNVLPTETSPEGPVKEDLTTPIIIPEEDEKTTRKTGNVVLMVGLLFFIISVLITIYFEFLLKR